MLFLVRLLQFATRKYGDDWKVHQDNDEKHAYCSGFLERENLLLVNIM